VKMTDIFGTRLNRNIHGDLATVTDRIEHH
jgi:hypothetical protein